ncbi:MAG: hypothetical protein HYX53_17905 [Chloroflexi bacterium]|nr:hypothetical protein [Chloroflexota bacterium]
MAFTVDDVQDMIRLLATHPEWRAQLRPLIVGDEFDRLPAAMTAMAEAGARTDQRLEQISERLDRMAEAGARTDERLDRMAEAGLRTDRRLEQISERLDRMAERLERVAVRQDEDSGDIYEFKFARKVVSLLGEWVRHPNVVTLEDLPLIESAQASGQLTLPEVRQLRALDLMVRGGDRSIDGYPDVILAIEVSRKIDRNDIERAAARAALLQRAGYSAQAWVGGYEIDDRDRSLAVERGVSVRLLNSVA